MTAYLATCLLAASILLQGMPTEPRRTALDQCFREVRTACGPAAAGDCVAVGRRACATLVDDAERVRAERAANLRRRIPGI